MLKYFKIIRVLVISVMLITSCSGPEEVHEYSVTDLEFSLEGPLFAGPNSSQNEISIVLADVLGNDYVEGMRIRDARMKSAIVLPNDSLGFAQINAFVVSFASDNEDISMQEVAVKNPLEEGAAQASLDVAQEAELGEIMEEGNIYVVLDVDLAEDYWDGNRDFKLNFTIELTIK